MPWYTFKEIWTPLKLIGIKFFKEVNRGNIWIKLWRNSRKPLIKKDKH